MRITPDLLVELLKAEEMCPLQYPEDLVPRWRQVANRVKALVANDITFNVRIHQVIDAACEAYLASL